MFFEWIQVVPDKERFGKVNVKAVVNDMDWEGCYTLQFQQTALGLEEWRLFWIEDLPDLQ